jgi:hypothetical protein
MLPTEKRRPRQSQDDFVTLTCPTCGTRTKAPKDDQPTLPDECATCIERQTQTQVDALETGQATVSSQREIAAMQGNIARLQGEQRKQGAELTALRGDVADIRRLLQQLAGNAPAPKGRKAKG